MLRCTKIMLRCAVDRLVLLVDKVGQLSVNETIGDTPKNEILSWGDDDDRKPGNRSESALRRP
jgi:hypothetical protein